MVKLGHSLCINAWRTISGLAKLVALFPASGDHVHTCILSKRRKRLGFTNLSVVIVAQIFMSLSRVNCCCFNQYIVAYIVPRS